MLLSQLEYFLAVVRNSGFTKSARQLAVGQPTVSHQVKRLERQLGVQLFARDGRSVTLTRAGHALAQRAERILAEVHAAEAEMKQLAAVSPREAISFGTVTGSVATFNVSTLLAEFARLYPGVEIQVKHEPAQTLLPMLAERHCDLAMFLHHPAAPTPRGVHVERLQRLTYGVLVPRAHRLASMAHVTLRDLQDESLTVPAAGSPVRAAIDSALLRAGVTLSHQPHEITVTDAGLRFQLVKEGFGIGLFPQSAAQAAPDDLTWLPISGTQVICWIALAWMPDPAPAGATQQLIALTLRLHRHRT